MTRHLSRIAVLALASCAMPMFAMANEGGSGGGHPVDLATALGMLDPDVPTDWNKGGQPAVERLQALTGNQKLTRADVVAAAPDLDRERAPKVTKAKAPAPAKEETGQTETAKPSADEPPAWAAALMARIDEQDRTIATLTEQLEEANEGRTTATTTHQDADDVIDGDLPPHLRVLDPNDPNAGKRPPAAPTTLAMGASVGDSMGIHSLHPARGFEGRMLRKWPGGKGGPLKDVEVVAIAVGQYPAQPGKLRYVGERFTFSGIPGSWFVPAASPQVAQFLSGELGQDDAARLWGLRAETAE